jgi:hypothetical protein
MGVLDDAIREHLELKRAHGATDDEITRQSQEALGPPRRERPHAEEADGESGESADAATAVEPAKPDESGKAAETTEPADDDLFADMPGRESAPEIDVESPGDAPPPPGPILPEQGGNGAQGSAGTPPADPLPEPEPSAADVPPEPSEPAGDPDATMLYEAVGETRPDAEPTPAPESSTSTEPESASPTESVEPAEAPVPAEPAAEDPEQPDAAEEQSHDESEPPPAGEDVLEDTPEFLQETPEDERLWFEQKPPRDFDFDD